MISTTGNINFHGVTENRNHMTTLKLPPFGFQNTLVILLSMLGLNASPLKNVTRSGPSGYFLLSRKSFSKETNRAAPPTGSWFLSLVISPMKTTQA